MLSGWNGGDAAVRPVRKLSGRNDHDVASLPGRTTASYTRPHALLLPPPPVWTRSIHADSLRTSARTHNPAGASP
jgi:hypothetical protein